MIFAVQEIIVDEKEGVLIEASLWVPGTIIMKKTISVCTVLFLLLTAALLYLLLWESADQEKGSLPVPQSHEEGFLPPSEMKEATEDREMIQPESTAVMEKDIESTDLPQFLPMKEPGWNVWGKVSDQDGNNIAGAEVIICYRLDYKTGEPAGPALSNESGIYTVNVSLPAHLAESIKPTDPYPGSLSGYVSSVGYWREQLYSHDRSTSLPDPYTPSNPVRVDFTMERGAVLHGRVLDENGCPVQYADINLISEGEESWDLSGKTDGIGIYMIPIMKSGIHYLNAMKDNLGISVAGPLDLVTARDFPMPDLYLQGLGEIAGSAVYPDGTPAREVKIFTCTERFTEKVLKSDNTAEKAVQCLKDQMGLPFSQTETDQAGLFRLCGLGVGRYFLGLNQNRLGKENHSALYPVGTNNARIVVDQYRLKVTVHDGEGFLVPEAYMGIKYSGGSMAGSMNLGNSRWIPIAPGPVAISVSHGERKVSKKIQVAKDQYETMVEMIFDEPPEPGQLRLQVTGPEGEPVKRIQAWFTNKETGFFETSLREESESGEYLLPVPPGRFDLQVREWAMPGKGIGYLAAELNDLELVSGQETAAEASMQLGGNLHLVVRLSAMDEEPQKAQILAKLKNTDKRIFFCWITEGGYASSTYLKPDIPLLTERPLEPGAYTLEVTAKGYEPAQVLFTIIPGVHVEREVQLFMK